MLGNPTSRSYILAKGLFAINDDWVCGFTAERASDPLIFDRYGVDDPFEVRGLYAPDDRRLISQVYTTHEDADSCRVSVTTALGRAGPAALPITMTPSRSWRRFDRGARWDR